MSDMMCCPLSSSDDAYCEEWDESKTTSTKIEKCIECDDEIPVGELYHCVDYVFEGEPGGLTTCLTCAAIRNHFGCEGYSAGIMWDELCENFFPSMSAGGQCMTGLSPELKQVMFDAYNRWLPSGFEEREWWQNQDELAHRAREWLEKQRAAP